MSLGLSRPRNYGREVQQGRLALVLLRGCVAYRVRQRRGIKMLALAGHDGTFTLPFEDVAELLNVRRGRWEAHHVFDGRLLAAGVSETDVVARTIEAAWR